MGDPKVPDGVPEGIEVPAATIENPVPTDAGTAIDPATGRPMAPEPRGPGAGREVQRDVEIERVTETEETTVVQDDGGDDPA